ncbi:exostosin family-domain-containing protein [Mycena pura]|uniref:Exostosin family-domain-containing protein n=1 Tax=Mycena pura TaxID=153505 RepID=A0AAD7E6N5_9AGAR|nr:exostosin family-domain-containing protein [Mycena pura]
MLLIVLSSVYGSLYDHKPEDRLVSAFVSRALAHQTLQIIGGQQEIDFLHIHDCIDAFILAVARLERKTKKAARSQVLVEIFDVTGSKATVRQLLDKVLVLTRSKSPIQTLPQDNRFSMHYLEDSVTLLPEYTAKIRLDSGLIRLVGLYLKESVAYLEQKVQGCASDSPPHVVANRDLLKLHGCTANLLMAVEGQVYSLAFDRNPKRQDDMGPGTPDDYGSIWVVSELIIPDLLKVHIDSRDGNFFVQLQAVRFVFDHVELEDIGSDRAIFEWEIIINEPDGAFKLVLPDSGYQVFPPRRFDGWFSWIDVEADVYSFRLIPICCPSPPLPFYEQDPIQHSIHFDRYSKERPFDKTIPQTLCLRAKAALARVQDAIEYLDDVSRAGIPPNTRFMGDASGWVNKELLACANDCNHPTICMDTDDCACVEALFCPPPQRFPFLHRLGITYPPLDDRNSSLPEIVEQTSWMSVLRPEAARYLSADPSWPSVHVAAVNTTSESLRGPRLESVARLLDRDCFSADASMEMALRGRGRTSASQADIIFQPYYHARMWTGEGNLLDRLESNYPNHAGQVAIPFTYDWGLCLFFTWTIWDVRIRFSIPSAFKNVLAWSVMGDLNSPCYRPHQDILIPPRSCRTRELRPAFSDPARIGAPVDRTYLAFFHGTTWGQGGTLRRKLVCNRPLPNQGLTRFEESRVGMGVGHLPLPRPKWDKPRSHDDYVSILNSTIFCAVPPGVAGWAPRIEDAIFAGCIPVMFDDTSHLPFWELLDWSKFSVRVFTHEVQYLEEILMSYSMQEIQNMQANLLHVRDILMYPLDDEHEDMLVTRSPLSFALHQTQLRLLTRWPISGPEFYPSFVDVHVS